MHAGGADPMTELFEHGKQILAAQPFSRRLGARLTLLESGRASIELDLVEELKQQHGFAHGGVLSYLADNCMTYAGASVLGDSVTSEFKINYLRPALGEKLIARASVLHSGKTQAVCHCEVMAVTDDEEKVVAIAQGTIRKIAQVEDKQ
jgi:uncharacterized protein (TIGR00369 family)